MNKRRKDLLNRALKNGFDRGYLCLLCLEDFRSDACPHSLRDNEDLITAYRLEKMKGYLR